MTDRYGPPRFSRSGLRGLKPSATLSLNDRVREMWGAGLEVYHLGFGESRFPVYPKIAEALRANVHQRSYLPAMGIWELRETIAGFYHRKFRMEVSPDQVVTGPGSKSLLYALVLALGEELILPQPSWVSYASQAHMVGKPVNWVPMSPDRDYQLDIGDLLRVMEDSRDNWGNPEVLVLNSPNNPTGTMLSPDAVRALAEFAREQRLMVLSDEIYALTAHCQVAHVSPAQHYPEGTVALGGLSKHLSLGGWRFGLAILPPGPAGEALRQALDCIAGSIWSCVAAPVQYAALVAYSDDPDVDGYIDQCTRMHSIRTRYLYQGLVEAGVPCVEPSGGFYVFPSFDRWKDPLAERGVHTADDLAMYLLENYQLATLPGSAFGCPPEELCLRLSSSYLDTESEEKVASLVEVFTQDPDPDRFIENHHPQTREATTRIAEFVAEMHPF
jgi:aspartate aminotransferase